MIEISSIQASVQIENLNLDRNTEVTKKSKKEIKENMRFS